jgi:predicted nucleic-acid-binding protein
LSVALDTNVLVRFLTWDAAQQAVAAAAVIESGEAMTISTTVPCELAWALKRSYRYHSDEIADAIRRIVTSRKVQTERVAAEAGLRMLGRGGDFPGGFRGWRRHVLMMHRRLATRLAKQAFQAQIKAQMHAKHAAGPARAGGSGPHA